MPKFKELLRVAIVEDDDSYAETLQEYLNKYEQENEVRFQVVRYEDGADLVEKYHGDFDILIMDIELKFMDGMTAAQHIRKMDSNVIIIFVTNMPQFALKGYQVDALDYVLKPISYYAFSQRLERALERMERRSAKKYITLHLKGRVQKVNILNIMYIEALQHDLIYHMDKDGDDVLVIILSDRTYEQQIRGHMEDALHTAEAANLAKSQFLANMSHDIRTPMNAIVGFSQLLLRHEKKPEKVKKYAEKIVISSQHLLSLINDVLDMSKIESGKTTLNLSDVNVADIVQEIDNIIRPQAKQKNQTFIVRSDNVEYGWIKADKLRLNQILLNILSNAVKYTPEGGIITFEIRGMNLTGSQFAKYKFEITDNGIGMSDQGE